MTEFLSNYGLWLVLGGIFVAMHMFGMGCGGHGGHQHGSERKAGPEDEHAGHDSETQTKAAATPTPARPGGCH